MTTTVLKYSISHFIFRISFFVHWKGGIVITKSLPRALIAYFHKRFSFFWSLSSLQQLLNLYKKKNKGIALIMLKFLGNFLEKFLNFRDGTKVFFIFCTHENKIKRKNKMKSKNTLIRSTWYKCKRI